MSSDRRRGYRTAMAQAGLKDEVQVITGEGSIEGGRRAGEALVALDPLPTAVITYNDEAAWGIMRTLSAHRIRVPDDVSLVGYDDSPLARMAPRELTTIHQDADRLGRHAVRRAIERLEGEVPSVTDEVLPPSLVEGETAGPARTDGAA